METWRGALSQRQSVSPHHFNATTSSEPQAYPPSILPILFIYVSVQCTDNPRFSLNVTLPQEGFAAKIVAGPHLVFGTNHGHGCHRQALKITWRAQPAQPNPAAV